MAASSPQILPFPRFVHCCLRTLYGQIQRKHCGTLAQKARLTYNKDRSYESGIHQFHGVGLNPNKYCMLWYADHGENWGTLYKY